MKLHIEPIKLLSGSHPNTAKTGSGCFMNVIAYLNGEPQITDQSPCVCVTIRKFAIWLNDFMTDTERSQLIPFIHRAMGSATDDAEVMRLRLGHVVAFAEDMASLAKKYAPAAYATAYAAAAAAAASSSAASSSAYATAYATAYAANAAAFAGRSEIIARCLAFLDAVCPVADEPTTILIERANRLVELCDVPK